MKRAVLLVALVAFLLLTAGCMEAIDDIRGGGDLSYSANPIHVEDSTVSETAFEQQSDDAFSFERSIEVQGQSQSVSVGAHMVHLTRSFQGAPLGHVVLLSIPQAEVLGQQIDIAERVGPENLIGEAQASVGDLERQGKLGERSVQILGGERTVEVYSGTTTQDGQSADTKIYVLTFDHESDTIVGVAIVPQVESDVEGSVLGIFKSIQYDG